MSVVIPFEERYTLNNVATQNNYADATTLFCPGTQRLLLQISNAAIYIRFGLGDPKTGIRYLSEEVFFKPSFASLFRRCDFVQIRSALAGTPAQVTIEAMP